MNSLLKNVGFNHVAFRVQPGRLYWAARFFEEVFGWLEDEGKAINEPDYCAKFVNAKPDFTLQLAQLNNLPPVSYVNDASHFAVTVDSAQEAIASIGEWAKKNKEKFRYEWANEDGTKWFIYLEGIFAFAIELVSRPLCPTCRGKGRVSRPYQRDNTPVKVVVCPDCHGSKTVK